MSVSRRYVRHIRDMAVFAMFAALMFGSRVAMAALPNIHLVGMFVMLLTVVYRFRALIPIYLYVVIEGIFAGFALWWIPYLYIWTILWGVTMLLPRRMPTAIAAVVYPIVCGLAGLTFGTLYAPVWAIASHYTFEQTLAWIVAGLPYDALHALGNTGFGCLVLPLANIISKLDKQ